MQASVTVVEVASPVRGVVISDATAFVCSLAHLLGDQLTASPARMLNMASAASLLSPPRGAGQRRRHGPIACFEGGLSPQQRRTAAGPGAA
jgi:hypothetical protein